MTSAEQKRRHREKVIEHGSRTITIELPKDTLDIINIFRHEFSNETLSSCIGNILKTWAIDTAEALPKLRLLADNRDTKEKDI